MKNNSLNIVIQENIEYHNILINSYLSEKTFLQDEIIKIDGIKKDKEYTGLNKRIEDIKNRLAEIDSKIISSEECIKTRNEEWQRISKQ